MRRSANWLLSGRGESEEQNCSRGEEVKLKFGDADLAHSGLGTRPLTRRPFWLSIHL